MSVTVSTLRQDEALVVYVSGEVDVSNADQLRSALNEALSMKTSTLEVDLGNVPYIDSTGIGVLVGTAHRAAEASTRFVVSNPQRNVARVLAMLGVDGELGLSE